MIGWRRQCCLDACVINVRYTTRPGCSLWTALVPALRLRHTFVLAALLTGPAVLAQTAGPQQLEDLPDELVTESKVPEQAGLKAGEWAILPIPQSNPTIGTGLQLLVARFLMVFEVPRPWLVNVLPHPCPLPKEREIHSRPNFNSYDGDFRTSTRASRHDQSLFPLPGGEGWGEGGRPTIQIPISCGLLDGWH